MTGPVDYEKLESAVGLNWYEVDPNLRALMGRYLSPQDRDWAEERLLRWGEICGGPIAANAEPTAARRSWSATMLGATR